jgi:hypothetical protein
MATVLSTRSRQEKPVVKVRMGDDRDVVLVAARAVGLVADPEVDPVDLEMKRDALVAQTAVPEAEQIAPEGLVADQEVD